jgi:DNA-binding NarL/FixJ family response regulator
MINIVIVEDNKTIREGLSILINATDGMKCVAHYKSCEKMLEYFEDDAPDLMLMDIGLPGMSGIEGIKEVKKRNPDIVILILSIYERNDYIIEALCAGASGYMVKKTPPAQLISALVDAHKGGSPMNSHIARKVVNLFQNFVRPASGDVTLSQREKDILKGLSSGKNYKMLSDELCISVDTVRYHIRNIYQKLQASSQSEAVAKALRKRLI